MKIKIKTGNRKLDKRFKELNKTQKAKIVASITRGAKPTTIAKKINAFAATNKAQIRREFLKTRTAAATVASQINRLVAKKDKSYRDFQKLNRLYRDYYKAKENRAKTYREKQE
ncbi:MAG: hypothetical protein HUJ68_00155 [Clostridia bacterium]|nr:hypothetical protein [Clostridia bacterium]